MKYVKVSDIVCKVSIKGSQAGAKVFPHEKRSGTLNHRQHFFYFLSVYRTTQDQVCDPFYWLYTTLGHGFYL